MTTEKRLPWTQRLCFGVGHALNDLTSSMWFSYLIVYLQLVLGFDSNYAGMILLIGQVVDAIATPLLGFETSSGHVGSLCQKYGRRKFLHLIGTVCVLLSFPFVFINPGFDDASQMGMVIFLVPFVVIFQFGWAATQVSHLSLIPVITPYESERDFLNALRFSIDVVSDIVTYVVVWMIFDLTPKPAGDDHKINAEWANKFTWIVLIISCFGAILSFFFHIGVREVKAEENASPDSCLTDDNSTGSSFDRELEFPHLDLSWKDWLLETQFYQVGLLYMSARMFQNLSGIFMPLYLQESLGANEDFIAKVPLVMNISGFFIACILPKAFKIIRKKPALLLGAAIGIGSCSWIAVSEGYPFCSHGIYGAAALMGTGSTMLVVGSLSLIHDLIGSSVESGAFVYGCMSFADKLANGVAGMLVQYYHSLLCDECDWFYKYILSYGVGGTAVISIIAVLTLCRTKLGTRTRFNKHLIPSYRTRPIGKSSSDGYGAVASDSLESDPLLHSNI